MEGKIKAGIRKFFVLVFAYMGFVLSLVAISLCFVKLLLP